MVFANLLVAQETAEHSRPPTLTGIFGAASYTTLACPLASCAVGGYAFGVDWDCSACSLCGGKYKKHTGDDLRASAGTKVYAAEAGNIKLTYSLGQGWGNGMLIEHTDVNGNKYVTQYLHVNPLPGLTKVTRLQQIATVADISGPHLHFGVWNSSYATLAQRGALPSTSAIVPPATTCCDSSNHCDGAFPQSFVNPIPEKPTGVSASDGTSSDFVTVQWNVSSGTSQYQVLRADCATCTVTTLSSQVSSLSYNDSSANIGKTYTYWVTASNAIGKSGNSSSDTGFRANSSSGTCTSPLVLAASGGTATGSTSGSSALNGSCGGSGAPEKVYKWTPSVSGSWTVSLCGSSYDTVLYVRSGLCSTGTTIACNDDTSNCSGSRSGNGSKVTIQVTGGQTYYIVVDGYSASSSGNFKLSVSR
jgi:hypothetical protein